MRIIVIFLIAAILAFIAVGFAIWFDENYPFVKIKQGETTKQPKIGEYYVYYINEKNPFEDKDSVIYYVTAVKDGFIQYKRYRSGTTTPLVLSSSIDMFICDTKLKYEQNLN